MREKKAEAAAKMAEAESGSSASAVTIPDNATYVSIPIVRENKDVSCFAELF